MEGNEELCGPPVVALMKSTKQTYLGGVPPYTPPWIIVAYLVAHHQDISVLILPLNPDIYAREQGDTQFDLGSTKILFGGALKNNSRSREKRVEFQRELGAGDPPYRGSQLLLLMTDFCVAFLTYFQLQ